MSTRSELEHQLTHLTELNQETIWDSQAARAERDEALARVAVLEAELARIRQRVTDLVDAGWMSQEAATELRNVYDGDEEGQR